MVFLFLLFLFLIFCRGTVTLTIKLRTFSRTIYLMLYRLKTQYMPTPLYVVYQKIEAYVINTNRQITSIKCIFLLSSEVDKNTRSWKTYQSGVHLFSYSTKITNGTVAFLKTNPYFCESLKDIVQPNTSGYAFQAIEKRFVLQSVYYQYTTYMFVHLRSRA